MRKEKKKMSDEDMIPTRQKVREFFEGKFVTILMAAVTIFALFGDDFRLWFTTKSADVFIDAALIFSLVAFTVEILVNSCVVDEFKYSFFFWLDIIATVSICVDVSLLSNFIVGLFGQEPETGDAQVGAYASQDSGSDKVGKIVKALRLIRLIRIIKLYKYVVKSGSEMEEMRLREQQKQSQNAGQAALNRELEPSRLGRSLSEALTRRLIILVLVLLMALPAITYSSFDVSHMYGMRQLFWFGRSNCIFIEGQFECQQEQWMSQAGWEEHLRNFISAASAGESEPRTKEVLWIHAPDFSRNGVIGDIRNVTNRQTEYKQVWISLKFFEDSYDRLMIEPVREVLEAHLEKFGQAYESLTEDERKEYHKLVEEKVVINPFDRNRIFEMLEAGLEQATYTDLLDSYKNVNSTLTSTVPSMNVGDREAIKMVFKERDYFKTLEFQHSEIKDWLLGATTEYLDSFGTSEELNSFILGNYGTYLDTLHKTDDGMEDQFDFFKLLFGDDEHQDHSSWVLSLTWLRAIPLQWLKRNWFKQELYWQEDPNCRGYYVDDNPDCDLRAKELELLTYTPQQCANGTIDGCDRLISYSRLSIKGIIQEQAFLQFMTTIFTCIILGAGAIMFANDTQELVINPITKMVSIIKTLADDPLQKPDPPQFEEDETQQKGQMKTIELQKTIFRIGNLLQMSFGQLGAIIIRDQVSSGDGNLEIMIPGIKINAIFMICKINQFVDYTDVLKTNLTDFLNKITSIVHQCAFRWDGWANKSDGNKYVITWKLPDVETNSNDVERNESLQEQRTEMADESLITAIKIVSEIRRAQQFNVYFRKNQMVQRFGSMTRPYLTFGLHLGWTIQGAIGSDNKIDACYLSPHLQIANRLEEMTKAYDMQILLSEPLYNFMSLKARNTLRKIDVILMNTFGNAGLQQQQEPMGLYTFDMSFKNLEVSTLSEDHQVGDLIKLSKYETINIENFKNKGVDYMFTLDSDIVGLQQHIMEFNPLFRQAFKSYISGDWGAAYEHIERCLELWEDDGPTKALQLFMSHYQFQAPSDWANYRNIDAEINVEDQFNLDNLDEDMSEDGKKGEEAKKQEVAPAEAAK